MSNMTLGLPVSVEQVAAVIKQMNRVERQRLLTLVRELNGATKRRVKKANPKRRQYAFAKVRTLLRGISENLSNEVMAERADRV